ncbi:hypothetical protein ABG067_004408 [Albugo candida]|uniref:Receptor expression-enhancing protein n=1 Tax=Albugo candida TaxID=65357 RepID=A0A024GBB1_9STRA|nr:unnamed protein product [Albugo candida]|eukprot:CCI43929.1 unnamed protein product [Albugo candida]
MDKVHVYLDKWSKDLDKIKALQAAQHATGVDKMYLVGGSSAIAALFLLIGFGAGFICNLIGFVYPTYCSFRAVESPSKGDDVQWLTYWVIYACFAVLEVFGEFLLIWIPFYYAFKLGFLLWLFMPSTQGASFLYNHFLSPLLACKDSKIERTVKDAISGGGALISDVKGTVGDFGRDITKAAGKIVEDATQ